MTDFPSENERRIKLEQIISNIKKRNKNDHSAVDQVNETDSCKNKNSLKEGPINVWKKNEILKCRSLLNTQSNIKNYFTVAKNAVDIGSSSRDVTIRSLLNTLKTNKESSIVTIFEDNSAKINTGSYQVQNPCNEKTNVIHDKHERDEQFNTSAEVIRKTHNYHKKQNNKRLRLGNNTKQLFVTDFFNVDHRVSSRVSSNKTKDKTSNILSDDEGKKSKLLDVPEVAEKNSMGNNVNEIYFDKNVEELRSKSKNSNSESLKDKKYQLICNAQPSTSKGRSINTVAKNCSGQICDVNSRHGNWTNLRKKCINKDVHANKNVSVKIEKQDKNKQNKTTFDDFCKNVISIIDDNSKENKKADIDKGKKQLQFWYKTPNFFPKSYSTGNLVGKNERKTCKDLSSLPITDIEIKSRKEKLVQSKITFDDFMKNVFKDINLSIIEADCGKNIDISCTSEENNNVEDKKRNIKYLTESLKSDGHDTVSTIMDIAKHSLSKCSNEELCQNKSENIIHKRNTIESEHILTKVDSGLENLELSVKYFENGNDKDKNKIENENGNADLKSSEIKETESEDFLLYFPKNWSESNNLMKEPPVELLNAETKNLTNFDCSKRDYALNICNEISHEMETPQEDSNITQLQELIKEKKIIYEGDNLEAQSTCDYMNFSESNMYVENNNQNSMSECNMTHNRSTEQFENNNAEKLDRFLLKLLEQNALKDTKNIDENHDNKVSRKKTYIKRYRKGKTKIYRLKKLKKISAKSKVLKEKENNLNFDDVFKKITQDIVTTKDSCLSRSRSMSSVSTSSSYITDVTRSEILSTGSNELASPEQRLRRGFNDLCKDKSLLFCEEQWENSTEYEKEELKMKIQEIVSRVVEDFSQKNCSSLKYRRQSFDNCIFKDGRLQLKPVAEASVSVINSRSQRSQARFTIILYILKKIQNLLETDTKLTKRELYYQLKTSVKNQRITDRALNAISCLLDVGMWALNIIAQKGLVFGNLKILLSSGETLNCNIPGTLIPQDVSAIVEIESPAYFILVVEKESIFYKLIEENLPNRLTRPFIMITGKGFPDLNTQLFLKKLWMIMSIPVFILVDADPHGINIMLNYRFGSVNNAHVSHQLAVPQAKWLGVYPSEVINLNITRELLSERELKLVSDLLKTPYMNCNPRIANELEVLLEKKHKAEIEGLIKSDTYLSEVYLPNKFFTHNFI